MKCQCNKNDQSKTVTQGTKGGTWVQKGQKSINVVCERPYTRNPVKLKPCNSLEVVHKVALHFGYGISDDDPHLNHFFI